PPDERVDARVREARNPVLDDRAHLRRGERHDRRPDAHRFANGEPEARVTDRVEDEAVARHQPRQLVVRNLAEPADRLRPEPDEIERDLLADGVEDRKSTRLNSSHVKNSYAVFCLKKKKKII